jgi:serpin B
MAEDRTPHPAPDVDPDRAPDPGTDAGADTGPRLDAGPRPDAGPGPDADPRLDADPCLDAGPGPNAGPDADERPAATEVGRQPRRRRTRRRVLIAAGTATTLAAAVAITVATTGGGTAGPQSGEKATGPGYRVSVRTVGLGGGVSHLVAQVDGTTLPPPSATTARQTSADETAFAVDLLQKLATQSGDRNVLDSPLSADLALSMLELGARGGTRTGIATALHSTDLDAGRQAATWGRLQSELRDSGPHATLQLADSTWAQDGAPIRPQFLAALAQSLGNVAYRADFAGHNAAATAAIDHLVDTETAGRIPQLFAPGSLDASTVLVLVNALHFHAAWDPTLRTTVGTPEPFGEGSPATGTRVTGATNTGATKTVATITGTGTLGVSSTGGVLALSVPYAGDRYEAVAVEPEQETLDRFVRSLTGPALQRIVGSMRAERSTYVMPSLSLSSSELLNPELSAIGMSEAFSTSADLSGILPDASVSAVQQAARLKLDQDGTDAAAATGIGITSSSISAPVAPVRIDRPYLLLLRDRRTGVILMTALVQHPAT